MGRSSPLPCIISELPVKVSNFPAWGRVKMVGMLYSPLFP